MYIMVVFSIINLLSIVLTSLLSDNGNRAISQQLFSIIVIIIM